MKQNTNTANKIIVPSVRVERSMRKILPMFGNILLPTYSEVYKCEQQLLNSPVQFTYQTSESAEFMAEKALHLFSLCNESTKNLGEDFNNFAWYLESLTLCTKVCRNPHVGKIPKLWLCTLLISRKPITQLSMELVNYIRSMDFELQTAEHCEQDWYDIADKWDSVKNHPFTQKITKVLASVSILSIAEQLSLPIKFVEVIKYVNKISRFSSSSLISSLFELIIDFIKRIGQVYRTGELSAFLHCPDNYNKFSEDYARIKRWSQVTGNCEAHGFTYFEYLSDLQNTVEVGDAICKIQKHAGDNIALKKMLADLKMIQALEITKRSAQENRAAPYGVLVFGPSSIAKSQVMDLLFSYYGKLFSLPLDASYRYVRNPVDEFWTNFNTSKWCIQLDDIAFLKPDAAPQGDPSVLEMLQVINNVPFVPTQADLADKGRTPCKARLVIASTNKIDMNANSYFQCPLAVQRRLPMVLSVTVKREYRLPESHMVDKTKIPLVAEGEYPDIWNISVYKVEPNKQNSNRAELHLVKEYDDIYEFLKHFGENCRDHEKYQEQASLSSENMKKVEICQEHLLPYKRCGCVFLSQQTSENSEEIMFDNSPYSSFVWRTSANAFKSHTIKSITTESILWIWDLCWTPYVMFCCWLSLTRIVSLLMKNRITRTLIAWFVLRYVPIKTYGQVVSSWLQHPRQRIILPILTAMFLGLGAYMYLSTSEPDVKHQAEEEEEGRESAKDEHLTCKFQREEAKNVWYNDKMKTLDFDVPVACKSFNKNEPEFDRVISKNLARGLIRRVVDGQRKIVPSSVLFLKGNYAMINNHALNGVEDDYEFELRYTDQQGVSNNYIARVEQIRRYPERDIALVYIPGCPPKANIIKYISQTPIKTQTDGYYIMRDAIGILGSKEVRNIDYKIDVLVGGDKSTGYIGVTKIPTREGDCGSPLVCKTAFGPTIVGIHQGGVNGTVFAMSIDGTWLEQELEQWDSQRAIPAFEPCPPVLSAETAEQTLLPEIHQNSVLRWIEQGTANVYGTFTGFRAANKSKVVQTVIKEDVEAAFKTKLDYGKPVVSGWEPWHNNIIHMVGNKSVVSTKILDKVTKSFTKDILKGLKGKINVAVLSNRQAINGIDGVKFIDKMNRTTSMGFPWKRKKQYYLKPYNDGTTDVYLPKDIMDRAEEIIKKYHKRVRASPVFAASLKDCPTSRKDIKNAKTRVFAAAPIDMSLVTRKYLLTFTKLVQENMYIFEAGPGTVTQSLQWQNHFKYITQFGIKKIVAGDFSKFDKKMQAAFILAAFEIIIEVHRAAGWSESALNVIRGIAYDTAYSFQDFNGTLVEFFGTNPSGHALTVIINSLVNSLYMRYCYYNLNPEKEADTFKENVALFTYGDDNIMGVSDNCPWFNHTSIQEVLASIDVTYTMADKESESVPYIDIADTTFLKRKWEWNSEVGAMLAPLEFTSILRALCYKEENGLSLSLDMTQRFENTLLECFFHGREVFDNMLQTLLFLNENKDLKVSPGVFKTWDYYKEIFESKENHFPRIKFGHGLTHEFLPDYREIVTGELLGRGLADPSVVNTSS